MRWNSVTFVNNKTRHVVQQSVAVALLYVVMQCYALYMNTFHIFNDMPPLCPICVAIDTYDNSAVNILAASIETGFSVYRPTGHTEDSTQYRFHQYLPRAPPTSRI